MENRDRIRTGTGGGEPPMGDWATSEARDTIDAGRRRLDEVQRGAQAYASEAKDLVQGAVQQTREYAEGAREYVEDTLQQARDKMTEYREGGFDKVKHDLAGYTREQPMTALLIAAGAGLLLGWLSAGRR